MKGKRVDTMRRTGRHRAKKGSGNRVDKKKEKRTSRVVVFASFLVACAAVRLLFPQTAEKIVNSASQLIGRGTDFREAFAAVGRTMSGEKEAGDSLQDVYTAVFNPSETEISSENHAENAEGQSESAASEWGDGSEDTETVQTISGIYMMSPLPEDASLEMRNFGFHYTSPLKGRLTSGFGWREHPTEGGTRFHYGIDLAAEKGTEIVAFADGTVFATGESSTLGKYIIVHHAGGYRTLYAHCSEILVLGGSVTMGQVIARVGDTGTATGTHLHFELQDGSLYLNPIYYVSIW